MYARHRYELSSKISYIMYDYERDHFSFCIGRSTYRAPDMKRIQIYSTNTNLFLRPNVNTKVFVVLMIIYLALALVSIKKTSRNLVNFR